MTPVEALAAALERATDDAGNCRVDDHHGPEFAAILWPALRASGFDVVPTGDDAYNAAQIDKWNALTKAERLAMHEDDSYGACVICLEYVPHTDDESVKVAWPCAPVLLARMSVPTGDAGLDVERPDTGGRG